MKNLKCSVPNHILKEIHGICVNEKCTGPSRLLCMICLNQHHNLCQKNQILTKARLIEEMMIFKDKQEDESILTTIQNLRVEIMNCFDSLEQQLQINCEQEIKEKIDDQIYISHFSQDIWEQSYKIYKFSQTTKLIKNIYQEIMVSINSISQLLKELENDTQDFQPFTAEQMTKIQKSDIDTTWNNIDKGTVTIQMPSEVLCLDCSPDGKHIACGFVDNQIRIYDPNTQKQIGTLAAHLDLVTAVKYSPSGQFIASSSWDKTIRIWNIESKKQIGGSLEGHQLSINQIGYSIDGQFIVSASNDKTVRVWNCKLQQQDGNSLIGHTDWVLTVVYQPDGQHIVSGSEDQSIIIWNSITRHQVRNLKGHRSTVLQAQYSFNNKFIASCGWNAAIKIWNASTGKLIRQDNCGHKKPVRSIAISPDCQFIVTGSDDQTVRIYSVSRKLSGEVVHQHTYQIQAVQFSQKGDFILSGSYDRTIQITPVAALKLR